MTARRGVGALLLAAFLLAVPAGLARAGAGDLDPSFDGDGKLTLDVGGFDQADAVLVQPDGRIVLAGYGVFGNVYGDVAVTRLKPDGAFDSSFDLDGKAAVDFGGDDAAQAMALQPDGKIVVAGRTTTNRDIAVARLNPDGSLDPSFDPGGSDGAGKKVFGYGDNDQANALLVQPDGKIVVAGYGGRTIALAVTRLNPDGSFDASFDGEGTSGVDFGGIENGNAAALQPDGKIVVAGYTSVNDDVAVVRFNRDGSLDESFDGDGKKAFGFGAIEYAQALLVQPDGKLVLAGYGAGASSVAVTRLNPDGSFDSGFDFDGTAGIDFGGLDIGFAAALQENGKIVVAGSTSVGTDVAVAVARLQPGGALDTTFSYDGKATLNYGGEDRARALTLQRDGRILLAGSTSAGNGDTVAGRLEGDPPAANGNRRGAPGTGGAPAGGLAVPRCAGRRATIVGTGGRDVLRGTRRADVIAALSGNDRVLGGRGDDRVCGGAGNDRLLGGSGADRLLGGPGTDRLAGGRGRDKCIGGAGADRAACETKRSV